MANLYCRGEIHDALAATHGARSRSAHPVIPLPPLGVLHVYQFLKRRKEAEAEDRDGDKSARKSVRLTQLVSQSGVPRPAGVKQKLVALLRRHGLPLGLRLTGKGPDLALSLDDEGVFKAKAAIEVDAERDRATQEEEEDLEGEEERERIRSMEGSNDRRRTVAFVERQLNEDEDEGEGDGGG